MTEANKKSQEEISRRTYLKVAGGTIAGLAVGGALGYMAQPMVTAPAGTTTTVTNTVTETATVAVTGTQAVGWSVPTDYNQLDPFAVDPGGAPYVPGPDVFILREPAHPYTLMGQYKKPPPWKLAFLEQGGANEWSRQNAMVFTKWADRLKEVGLVESYIGPLFPFFDTNKQIAMLEDLTAHMDEIDGLLVYPLDPKALVPQLEKWYDAGKPVVAEGGPCATEKIAAVRYVDDRAFGVACGKWLVRALKGKGKVVVIRGPPGHVNDLSRWDGFKAITDKYPGIEILGTANGEFAYDAGKRAAESLLAGQPEVDGVHCASGSNTAAAVDVFLEQGRPLVPMTGEDYNGLCRRYLKYKPEFPNFDTIYPIFDTKFCFYGFTALYSLLTGMSIPKVLCEPNAILPGEASKDLYIEGVSDALWCSSLFAGLTKEDIEKEFGA